jgi:hypothetical protein
MLSLQYLMILHLGYAAVIVFQATPFDMVTFTRNLEYQLIKISI